MNNIGILIGKTILKSLTAVLVSIFSPRIIAYIVVSLLEPISRRTSNKWDDGLIQKIKEEWRL
jgi:hypothetical protein